MALRDVGGDWEYNPYELAATESEYSSDESMSEATNAEKTEGRTGRERSSQRKEISPMDIDKNENENEFFIAEYPYKNATPVYERSKRKPLTESDFRDYTKNPRYVPWDTFPLSTLRHGQLKAHFDGGSSVNFISEERCEELGIKILECEAPEYCDVLGGEVILEREAYLRVKDTRKGFPIAVGMFTFYILPRRMLGGMDCLVGRLLGGMLRKGSHAWRKKHFFRVRKLGSAKKRALANTFVWRGQHTKGDIDAQFELDRLLPAIAVDDEYEEIVKSPDQNDKEMSIEEMMEDAIQKSSLGSEEAKERLRKILNKYKDIFAKGEYDVGKFKNVEMKIPLKDAKIIHRERVRRMPAYKDKIVRQHVRKLERRNWIRKSNSPYASGVVLVKKPHGNEWRFCVDYRKLNANTIRDLWPLKNLHAILERLSEGRVFTVVDLRQGFFHLPIAEEDKAKTAFITPSGLYEMNRANYGMINTPSNFQRIMDGIFVDDEEVECYLDDVVTQTPSVEDHFEVITRIFERFKENGMKINLRKCQLFRTSIEFLGHEIGGGRISLAPSFKDLLMYNWYAPLEQWFLASVLGCILVDSSSLGLVVTLWKTTGLVGI